MRVRIHRGAHEIGGSCVEVESSSGERLVLDVGAPLSTPDGVEPPLPAVGGLVRDDPALLGIVLSHAHQDHWGLVDQALPSVPLFMGGATHRILAEAAFWTRGLSRVPDGFLEHRRSFALGPFAITPFLNDHSAYDAYSLLVETDGRRMFYTGDIRGHGRKRGIFEQLLRRPPGDIDVLLMEGTNVSTGEQVDVEPIQSEQRVEDACADVFRDAAGIVLAIYSAQNIDRMVTLFRAAKRADRIFVMTLYGASIALATGNANIPQPGWREVRTFVPRWQQLQVKEAQAFERVDAIKKDRVFEEDVAKDPSRWVVSFSMGMAGQFDAAGCLSGARAVWSMWPGYLKEESGKGLVRFLEERDIPLVIQHTSGHASISDLQRLAAALSPRRVVPIHTFGESRFGDLFQGVEHRADGEWWEV